jgi:hypothetical protein
MNGALIALLLIRPLDLPLDNSRPPVYNIESYCESVSQAVGGSYEIKAACIEQEKQARDRISGANIEARIDKYCDSVGQAVGGSYQIYEACVKQEIEAKSKSESP